MRMKHKVNVVVTEDVNGKNKLFAPDDALAEVTLDGFTEVSMGTVGLDANAAFNVPLGGISNVRGLYLKSSGDFALVLNGGAPVNITRGVATANGSKAASAKVFLEAALTSISLTNGALASSLSYLVWGDPL
jgi:lipid-binding SYLF domain-containing protein